MNQLNIKMPIIFRVALILLCVWMLSFHFVNGLYARYSSSASGSDHACVAKFNVSVTGGGSQSAEIDLSNGSGSVTYNFTVTSDSEVASQDTVTISGVPSGVTVEATVNGESLTLYRGVDHVFHADFPMGSQKHAWVLTFTADSNVDDGTSNIKIKVDVVQKD